MARVLCFCLATAAGVQAPWRGSQAPLIEGGAAGAVQTPIDVVFLVTGPTRARAEAALAHKIDAQDISRVAPWPLTGAPGPHPPPS